VKLNTAERARHLASAAEKFPFLGRTTSDELLELVRVELGDAGALDDFVQRGERFARAIAPRSILHIVSGNTPAAGLQSLIRGLLLGSHNFAKLPSAGLPEMVQFCEALPGELAERVEFSTDLSEDWLARAEAVIVFGSDETIAHFRARIRTDQTFIAHGHRLSFGVIFDDPAFGSVAGAARDASLFDQQGCLSPQVIYVRGEARLYAERLAAEMAHCEALEPRAAISLSETLAIRTAREEFTFRATNGEPVQVWQSSDSTAWTVVFDIAQGFPRSPLNRFVFVKPMPDDLAAELHEVRAHMSCAGIFPAAIEHARLLTGLGVSRVCPIGRMQTPPWTWHQDGQPSLGALVRWVDFEQ
jgi:hypothetical protein